MDTRVIFNHFPLAIFDAGGGEASIEKDLFCHPERQGERERYIYRVQLTLGNLKPFSRVREQSQLRKSV